MASPTTVERAFELARSGEFTTLSHIRLRLHTERFKSVDEHLFGASIRKQLTDLCKQARRTRQPAA